MFFIVFYKSFKLIPSSPYANAPTNGNIVCIEDIYVIFGSGRVGMG